MNTQHFKFLLREKKRELQSALQGTSELSGEGAMFLRTLVQVQDAFHRIDSGIYGTCLACGREIEISRLEEVIWTAFCLKDQKQEDQSRQVTWSNAVR